MLMFVKSGAALDFYIITAALDTNITSQIEGDTTYLLRMV